jgi:hemolysin III
MFVGAIAAAVLLALAASANLTTLWSVLAYIVGLLAMLGLSAAYHLHRSSERRELLRRLDHAAIFVMIAGTYTPFTACIFNGAWAVWSTASMWAAALAGVAVNWRSPAVLSGSRFSCTWPWAGPRRSLCCPYLPRTIGPP